MSLEEIIQFHTEDIQFNFQNANTIRNWLHDTTQQEGSDIASLSFVFCSDSYLHNINIEYLNHDTLTDVITFQYSEPESTEIEGDIFISIDRIKENAAQFQVTFEKELFRVMIHGTLHLLGYGDKSPDDKQLMTEKENFYLERLK
ncbi:MAG: rRNA maturation RNase YbeY [Saprospiraceae bacterium]